MSRTVGGPFAVIFLPDPRFAAGLDRVEMARRAISGGATAVQLRFEYTAFWGIQVVPEVGSRVGSVKGRARSSSSTKRACDARRA